MVANPRIDGVDSFAKVTIGEDKYVENKLELLVLWAMH